MAESPIELDASRADQRAECESEEATAMSAKQDEIPVKTKQRKVDQGVMPLILALAFVSLLLTIPAYGSLGQALRDLEDVDEIVFAVRQLKGPHWYENIGYAITDVNDKVIGYREVWIGTKFPRDLDYHAVFPQHKQRLESALDEGQFIYAAQMAVHPDHQRRRRAHGNRQVGTPGGVGLHRRDGDIAAPKL